MYRRMISFTAFTAVLTTLATSASAQARIAFQVFQAMPGSVLPASGAAVCLSSLNNTRITNGSGQTTFENIPVGAWAAHVWKVGYKARRVDITVPAGALVIPVVVQLSERSTEAPPCILPASARLGEERFPERGTTFTTGEDAKKKLDCHDFGASFVMVGLTGKKGEGVDHIKLACMKVKSDGTLDPVLRFTGGWDILDDAGTSFGAHCPSGRVVSGMRVSLHAEGQLRSIDIECKTLASTGLTTGTATPLDRIGTLGSNLLAWDRCTGGRPARAIRAGMDQFRPVLIGRILAPWVIATTQFFCEQPVM